MSYTNTKWNSLFILIAIFAISVNMRPAITSIGPMLDIIREELALTNAQVTLLTTIPVVCMGVFASLAPVLNRIFGLRSTLYVMITLIGVTTALRGFVTGLPVLLSTAFLAGVAIAVVGPLLSAMIKQKFPERAASVIGIYSLGMGVGSAASAGLTAIFYNASGSYLFALSIWSVLALVGLVSWFLAANGQLEVRQQTPDIIKELGGKSVSPWKSRKAWQFLLFFGFQSAAFFSIVTWLAPIALSAGMTLLQASTLLSIMMTVQIFFNIILPILMDRFPARKFWILFMLISGVAAISLFWSGIHSFIWVGAFIIGIPLGGLFPAALLLPLDETETAMETNAWTAMMQTGGFIIGGILPLLIALVYDWTSNHHFTFTIMMMLYILMAFLIFRIGDKKEVQTEKA